MARVRWYISYLNLSPTETIFKALSTWARAAMSQRGLGCKIWHGQILGDNENEIFLGSVKNTTRARSTLANQEANCFSK